ncbi:MAG TPA: GFA family protein [Caulobacteraceae bacterium]|jgi:hypothetical protein
MLTGGCLCGACRFEYCGAVGAASYCHCADCRRATGSAFNVGVRIAPAEFGMVQGTPAVFTNTGDSGRALSRHFCSDCGSPLFTSSLAHPDWTFVKAGALDDPTLVKPEYESWTSSEVPWARPSLGLVRYARGREA